MTQVRVRVRWTETATYTQVLTVDSDRLEREGDDDDGPEIYLEQEVIPKQADYSDRASVEVNERMVRSIGTPVWTEES
jgi:hypothetical protein